MAFKHQLIEVFLFAGTVAAVGYTIDHLFYIIKHNSNEIDYLSLRLQECEKRLESSQDHELKK